MQQTQAVQTGWHVANWGTWGWIETGLKLVGIVAGLVAFLTTSSASELTLGGHPELGAVILLALLSLFTAVPLFIRFTQREIISMIFAIFNFLGHTALLIGLLRQPSLQTLPLVFAIFFILGELAKQRFLVVSGYSENGMKTPAMLNFSRGIMAVYVLIAVFILI